MTVLSKHRIAAVVLAAGKGTRMKSDLPKVLHLVAGKTMLDHVLHAVASIPISEVCVVINSDRVNFEPFVVRHPGLNFCIQEGQLGTGDAVAASAGSFAKAVLPSYCKASVLRGTPFQSDFVLVCAGDVPAVEAWILRAFVEESLLNNADLAVLGMDVPNPFGYGRIVRDVHGRLQKIVEERDASDEIRKITLCNSGVIFGRVQTLFNLLSRLSPANAQKEYYLTDCFGLAAADNIPVHVFVTPDWQGFLGINDRQQLADMEERMQKNKAKARS